MPVPVWVPIIGRGCRRGPRSGASPETLPPGEGRRGAHARLSVGAKGRGITRRRSPTEGRDRRWGHPFAPSSGRPCVGEPAVPFLFAKPFACRTPSCAPAIVTRRRSRAQASMAKACSTIRLRLLNQRGHRDVPAQPPAAEPRALPCHPSSFLLLAAKRRSACPNPKPRPSDRHPKGGSTRPRASMGQRAGGGSGRDASRPIEPARPGS